MSEEENGKRELKIIAVGKANGDDDELPDVIELSSGKKLIKVKHGVPSRESGIGKHSRCECTQCPSTIPSLETEGANEE